MKKQKVSNEIKCYSFKVKIYIDYVFFTVARTIKYNVEDKKNDFFKTYTEVIREFMSQLNGNAIRITDRRGKTYIFDRNSIKRIEVKEDKKWGRGYCRNVYEAFPEELDEKRCEPQTP